MTQSVHWGWAGGTFVWKQCAPTTPCLTPCLTPSAQQAISARLPTSQGESVAMALYLVGARPVREGTGRIARFELIPLDELGGRPRIDVLCNMSGIFRCGCGICGCDCGVCGCTGCGGGLASTCSACGSFNALQPPAAA